MSYEGREICMTFWWTPGVNPSSANPQKWSNTLKQFVDELFECI